MANEHFQCDLNKAFLKRFEGNEKSLYLDISDSMITGKGIIFLESKRNTYTGDINYEFKSVKKVERTMYEGLEALIIYVRTNTLYGSEKAQIRLPNIREIDRVLLLLNKIISANDPNAKTGPSTPAPTPVAATAPTASVEIKPSEPEYVEPAHEEAAEVSAPVETVTPVAPAPVETVAPVSPVAPITTSPVSTPAPAPSSDPVSTISKEEFKKKLEKLEAIYQTGMLTEKEYRATKAEYISVLNNLDAFFNKVKVNIQYSEIGFLSEAEFTAFKEATIEESASLDNVSNEVLRTNLKKLLILNLFGVISDDEYEQICSDTIISVQYNSEDSESTVVEKIEKWPILKDCEIISEAQFEQFIKQVTDDTKIKMSDSTPVLEHKLTRLSTLSSTFLFTPEEFEAKKKELVAELTALDFSSDTKLKNQITCLVTLNRCGWLSDAEFMAKKKEILTVVESDEDVIARMQQFRSFAEINFISNDEYKSYEKKIIDDILRTNGDISELQKKAQNLMKLKEAGIISDADFNDYKRRLLSLA